MHFIIIARTVHRMQIIFIAFDFVDSLLFVIADKTNESFHAKHFCKQHWTIP